MDKMSPLPDWFHCTAREFKQQKRREMRVVMKALHDLRVGCAFLPNYPDINRFFNDAEHIQDQLSFKELGR